MAGLTSETAKVHIVLALSFINLIHTYNENNRPNDDSHATVVQWDSNASHIKLRPTMAFYTTGINDNFFIRKHRGALRRLTAMANG